MQNLSATHWADIRFSQRQNANGSSLSGDKLHLKGGAVGVAMHDGPDITFP